MLRFDFWELMIILKFWSRCSTIVLNFDFIGISIFQLLVLLLAFVSKSHTNEIKLKSKLDLDLNNWGTNKEYNLSIANRNDGAVPNKRNLYWERRKDSNEILSNLTRGKGRSRKISHLAENLEIHGALWSDVQKIWHMKIY